MLTRREFAAAMAASSPVTAAAPALKIAVSGFVWQNEIEEAIRSAKRFGFHGLEPFRSHLQKYLDRPADLKKQLDAAGLSLASCSNGGPGMTVDFIDPAKTRETIEHHEQFAAKFLTVFGCKHFKINVGRRPDAKPTGDQLKTMAETLNELGRRTAKLGLKLAPHPHIWSPFEREDELRRVMELTDPKLVWLVTDTAHLTLGGMDPVRIMTDYYARIAAIHFKDTEPKYKGQKGPTPTQEEHRKVNLYKNCGTGGVDFPAIVQLLRSRGWAGWITLDLDPPRPGDGPIDQMLTINKNYVTGTLKIAL